MFFFSSLSDSKSHHVSKPRPRIRANLNNAVVWMVHSLFFFNSVAYFGIYLSFFYFWNFTLLFNGTAKSPRRQFFLRSLAQFVWPINQSMYMDDIKLFAKNEKRIGNRNTGDENIRSGHRDIEKCAMLVMKSRKWCMTKGIELPNQENVRTLGESKPINSWEYRIIEADTIKQVEMKEKKI